MDLDCLVDCGYSPPSPQQRIVLDLHAKLDRFPEPGVPLAIGAADSARGKPFLKRSCELLALDLSIERRLGFATAADE